MTGTLGRQSTSVFFQLVLFLLFARQCRGYQKLGSPKPEECSPKKGGQLCPSHMICIPKGSGHYHCACDRFIGFRGPECRQKTRANWLLVGLSIVVLFWAMWALVSNIQLAFELKKAGRLKANNTGRTLFCNTMVTLPVMALAVGLVLTALSIDPDMKFYQHGRNVCITAVFFFSILGALTVSVVWIIDTSAIGMMGIESTRAKQKRQELVYLTIAYVISLSSAALVVLMFTMLRSNSIALVSLVGVLFNLFVGASYHYAGRRVVRDLHVVEVGISTRQLDIAQIAKNIRLTSKSMTWLTMSNSLSFVGLALTTNSSAPVYAAQNSLPRVLQGQLFYFATQACVLGVNQQIVEYIRYGSRERHHKPQHSTARLIWRLLCQTTRTVAPSTGSTAQGHAQQEGRNGERSRRRDYAIRPLSDHSSSANSAWSDSDDPEHDDSSYSYLSSSAVEGQKNVWLIGQNSQSILTGGGGRSAGGEIMRVHLGNRTQDIAESQLSYVPAAGARPLVPMVLATLHIEGVPTGDPVLVTAPGECRRVRGRAVMNVGDGVLVNLYSDEVSVEDFGGLTEGSHAFVRCFGERHLRCTWHAFDFGFAGGHSLLANSNRVLMAGEVEVDAQGQVTCWLIKKGATMPPRWATRQLGLSTSKAWRFVSAGEVDAMPLDRKAALLAQGCLAQLSAGRHSPLQSITDEEAAVVSPLSVPAVSASNVEASLVPVGRPADEENTWIVRVADDDHVQHCHMSQSAYLSACEAFHSLPFLARNIRRSLCPRYDRVEAIGGSFGFEFDGGWGLDDLTGLSSLSLSDSPQDSVSQPGIAAPLPSSPLATQSPQLVIPSSQLDDPTQLWGIEESADED